MNVRNTFVLCTPSHSKQFEEKSFNFNYIWTFLRTKQWQSENRQTTIKCTTGYLLGKNLISVPIDGAEKSNLIAMINKVIKIWHESPVQHEWDEIIGLPRQEISIAIHKFRSEIWTHFPFARNEFLQLQWADPSLTYSHLNYLFQQLCAVVLKIFFGGIGADDFEVMNFEAAIMLIHKFLNYLWRSRKLFKFVKSL